MAITRKTYVIGVFIVGIFYRLLMGLQGFDAIDMGHCMTFYQNIFTRPDAMPFYFNIYLTGVVGGLWNMLFGGWGVLGSRLLEVLTEAAAIALMYGAFRPWMRTTGMAVTAIGTSFLFPTLFISFHYDTLSFLCMAASIHAFMRWVRGGRLLWLGVAGLWLGVNFFARTVNGVLWSMALIPFLWGCRHSWRQGWTNASVHVGGIVAGCLLVFSLMACLGHCGLFWDGFCGAFSKFTGHEDTHSSSGLLSAYFNSFINVILQILCLVGVAVSNRLVQHVSSLVAKRVLRVSLSAILFILVYTSNPYLSAIAACTALFAAAVWPRVRKWLFIAELPWDYLMAGGYALGCAYLFPFGSDIGIQGIFNRCGGLLIVPATCCWQWLGGRWQRQTVGAVCLCVCGGMIIRTGQSPYGERTPRWEMTEMALPKSINVMTDHEKAVRYRNIVSHIAQYGKGNELLFVGNQAAELYYATHKLPFTGNTTLNAFRGEGLIKCLDKQHAYYGNLPVIVFLTEEDKSDEPSFRKDMQPWMEEHQYHRVYHDTDMDIFLPQEEEKGQWNDKVDN